MCLIEAEAYASESSSADESRLLQVEKIISDAITLSIGEAPFQHSEVKRWTDGVLETCLLQRAALKRQNKYVATVNVSQKAGSGMHVTSATVWDAETDGKASVHWTNATVLVLGAVYWTAI